MPASVKRLFRLIVEFKPDLVQTWLYHANVIAGLVARAAGVPRVIWGIRGTVIPQGAVSATGAFVRVGAWLSRWMPDVVVCNAVAGLSFHEKLGYAPEKLLVVPNGIDTSRFVSDRSAGMQYREQWQSGGQSIIVGMVARFDPLKDFDVLLDAAMKVAVKHPNARFVLVGAGLSPDNESFLRDVVARGLAQRTILAGELRDIAAVMNAFDVFCLSSRGEGFPNVVIEAMSCAIPCVVTDVGDAGRIVGDTGWVVPPRNPVALADALSSALALSADARRKKGEAARCRVLQLYTLEAMDEGFLRVYRELGCSVTVCE